MHMVFPTIKRPLHDREVLYRPTSHSLGSKRLALLCPRARTILTTDSPQLSVRSPSSDLQIHRISQTQSLYLRITHDSSPSKHPQSHHHTTLSSLADLAPIHRLQNPTHPLSIHEGLKMRANFPHPALSTWMKPTRTLALYQKPLHHHHPKFETKSTMPSTLNQNTLLALLAPPAPRIVKHHRRRIYTCWIPSSHLLSITYATFVLALAANHILFFTVVPKGPKSNSEVSPRPDDAIGYILSGVYHSAIRSHLLALR